MIKTRKEFQNKLRGPYGWIMRNNPNLMDSIIPSMRLIGSSKQKFLEIRTFCVKHKKFPVQCGHLPNESRLNSMGFWLVKNGFSKEIKTLKKKYGIASRSKLAVDAFIKILPSHVNLISQHVRMTENGTFNDIIYGKFKARLTNLAKTLNHGGIIGHPKRNKTTVHTRKSIIREDGKIYASIADAKRDGYSGVDQALSGKRKLVGGYRWAYCTEETK